MKVLHVITDMNVGGAGVLLTSLLRNFDPLRVQSIVALPGGSDLTDRIASIGVPTFFLNYPADRISYSSIRELIQIIKNEQVDLVHANASLCARIAGKRRGVGVVHTRHCCFPPSGIWRNGVIRKLGGICNRALSDRAIATAQAAEEDLLTYGIPQSRIALIINGSEPIRTVSTEELTAFRRAWRIAPDAFTVGICARLVPCKGQMTFLYAAKYAMEMLPGYRFCFLIVGDGPERAMLEQLAESLGISDSVRFLGFVSDMAPVYRSLRLNVNCSTGTETSCLALSEGMSAGVPMAVSDYGGNAAMVGDGSAGILCRAGKPLDFARAIVQIASDREGERAMRSAAYSRYCAHYTAARMAEEVTRLYESML